MLKKLFQRLTPFLLPSLVFIIGFTNNIIPAMILCVKAQHQTATWQIMLLQSVFFLSYFMIVIPGFILVQQLGTMQLSRFASLGCMLSCACLGLVFAQAHLPSLLLLTACLALSLGLLRVVTNAAIMRLQDEPGYQKRVVSILSCDTLGALTSPYISGHFLLSPPEAQSFNYAPLCFFMALSLAFALLTCGFNSASQPKDSPIDGKLDWLTSFKQALSQPRVYYGFVATFIFIGLEFSIPIFMGLLAKQYYTALDAPRFISGYWALILTGRLLALRYLAHIPPRMQIRAACILSIAIISLVEMTQAAPVIAFMLLGLCNANVYPSIFAHYSQSLDKSLHYTSSGIFLMGLSGGAIIPMLQAHLADYTGMLASFSIIIACYAMLLWMLSAKRERILNQSSLTMAQT